MGRMIYGIFALGCCRLINEKKTFSDCQVCQNNFLKFDKVILKTMASREAIHVGSKVVKPLLSTNPVEARRRVINLYKAWYRQIPYIG